MAGRKLRGKKLNKRLAHQKLRRAIRRAIESGQRPPSTLGWGSAEPHPSDMRHVPMSEELDTSHNECPFCYPDPNGPPRGGRVPWEHYPFDLEEDAELIAHLAEIAARPFDRADYVSAKPGEDWDPED